MADPALRTQLAELVAFDTQNPTGTDGPMVDYLAARLASLGADEIERFAIGSHHAVLARFGAAPRLLINAHVDTVPANAGYTTPPHQLVERGDRYYGLGSCDTKAAIAAILEALRARQAVPPDRRGRLRDVAILFSGDEEKGATVMSAFTGLAGDAPATKLSARSFERAIVCEPTGLRVGHRHRGIVASDATATSIGGHSSRANEIVSPLVPLARAAIALDAFAAGHLKTGPAAFPGLCLNIAKLDGGLAFNVIPAEATLSLSVRPAPGTDVATLLIDLEATARIAARPTELSWTNHHVKDPFATRDLASFAEFFGTAIETPLDLGFWTEAALLAKVGIDAVVFGPGDIAQAHAADEFVPIAELEGASATFRRILA